MRRKRGQKEEKSRKTSVPAVRKSMTDKTRLDCLLKIRLTYCDETIRARNN